ncbi:hypothetical protein PR202_ga20747 [Eleusine coracana subsp. coracana]|uniref:AP2/ERF domain-containing protein n=1 Tax=Eleusine coracana subsp. coracana TaxID=191504 RepID=A0AAV5CXX5_ELECO|nr:hypothetical protein QOZ80_8AG0627670 [Eleusine coracana subsp. coracana]GJN03317.1 hypothetical protein PR202_ga20747 [Eleusine coracana subsp. coracana]
MHARRIRISFSDPDATDSDSGDDAAASSGTPGSTTKQQAAAGKQTEIVILVGKMVLAAENNSAAVRGSKARSAAASSSPAAASGKTKRCGGSVKAESRFRGVYERQPGRWAPEFRSHRLKVRHWLGTFPTEEEAKAAYDAFEARFVSSSQSAGDSVLPLPKDHGRDVHRSSASLPADDDKRPVVLALMSAATKTAAGEPSISTKEGSVPSPPCVSCLTTASPEPESSWNAQLLGDALASFDQFWEEEPTKEDLIGLADLSHLPLPFSDGDLDHISLANLSLCDAGFL